MGEKYRDMMLEIMQGMTCILLGIMQEMKLKRKPIIVLDSMFGMNLSPEPSMTGTQRYSTGPSNVAWTAPQCPY